MKTIQEWAQHYDNKDPKVQSRTELVDWLIQGKAMTDEFHRRVYVEPTIQRLELESQHDFLEIGCGSGLFLRITEKLVNTAIGTDISSTMLDSFESAAQKVQCAAHELPFPENSFDRILMYGVVVCFPSFEYFKKVVNRALRTLRHKGIMLIGDVPFDAIASCPPNIHYDKHRMIDYLDSLDCPYSIVVPHYEKQQINGREDIIIYKD